MTETDEPPAAGEGPPDGSVDADDVAGAGRITRVRRQTSERISWARQTAEDVAQRVEAARPDTPVIDTGYEIYERDSSIAGGMLAGAIAFRLFLVIVPLLLILVAGLGFLHVAQADSDTAKNLDFSDTLVSTMSSVGENAARGRWVTLIIGLFALAVAMRTMVKSLRIVHHLAWRLERRRKYSQPKALAAGLGILALVVAYAFLAQWLRSRTPGGGITVSVVIGAGAGLIWLLVEYLLPRAERASWLFLLPGAALMAVATQMLHAFTVFYLAGRIDRMSETYGPLGVAIVVLLWLYLLGRAMVAAAVLNATIWDRHDRGDRIYAPIDLDRFRPDGDSSLRPDGDSSLRPDGDSSLRPDGDSSLRPDGRAPSP